MDNHAPHDEFQLLGKIDDMSRPRYSIPLAVLVELTHRCQLQCPYCWPPSS